MAQQQPKGTVAFSTIGRVQYGFDVFSVKLHNQNNPYSAVNETRLTDGVSINFNAQFLDDEEQSIVFLSERSGSPKIYLTRIGDTKPELLSYEPGSLFYDRPVLRKGKAYFISAHEDPGEIFKNWSALYAASDLHKNEITRLTPVGHADFSPSVSQSGRLIAVASYGSKTWGGEFQELKTDIVVFEQCDPKKRVIVCEHGGWPTWCGDETIYFHRQATDGWWSIFRVDFNLESSGFPIDPVRVTPPGVHCVTPAAFQDGKRIAVATRRRGKEYRHIEVFDVDSKEFYPVTELINEKIHHYNPFVSSDSLFLGYHRFRGESTQGDSTVHTFVPVGSPIKNLTMLRINGYFASFSPDGDLVSFNPDYEANGSTGIKIIKSDGSKLWTLFKDRLVFCNTWSPTEKHVIYTSMGPTFQPASTAVQIARVSFDPSDLTNDREEITCDIKILTKEGTANNAFPSCSPDGKSLVFRSGRTGYKNLFIIDAVNGEFEGGSIRQLTNGPWIDTMARWSPKGDVIAFSSNMHNPSNTACFSIYLIKPDGSDLKRVYMAGVEGSSDVDRERINHVGFSEDGEWILFVANMGGVTAEPVSWPKQPQPYGELFAARRDGSELKRLSWNGYDNGLPGWHSGVEVDISQLCSGSKDEEMLKAEFQDTLWLSADI
jgi:Tol biopolymer transport system component